MSATLDLTQDLISRNSVTPADAGCQEVMGKRLAALGFEVETLRYGSVENFWAKRRGTTQLVAGKSRDVASDPVLCFAGHTDVVPTGPLEEWRTNPFVPTLRDGVLYGRGAADMKSGLAAMITATEEFVQACPRHRGTIAFLITSDEEGPSVDGTKRVVETLNARGEQIDYCVVGEPSSERAVGDTLKIGRRGSLSGRLTVHGVQGHVAYPHQAENPVHTLAPNVIPGELKARFNLRYSPVQTVEALRKTVEDILQRHGVRYTLEWYVSGEPFYTPPGALSAAAVEAVKTIVGSAPKLSTGGGTSDGRFIAPMGAQVIELGVTNATIHKVNECVRVEEIDLLHRMYAGLLQRLLA
jgi:succinyl-diaminopimelate desuccinylase